MIWNPFKKDESKDTPVPFEGVVFVDVDGKRYDYNPTKTISPRDAAMLIPLFMEPRMHGDRFTYIRKHKLEKHFVEIVDGEE